MKASFFILGCGMSTYNESERIGLTVNFGIYSCTMEKHTKVLTGSYLAFRDILHIFYKNTQFFIHFLKTK